MHTSLARKRITLTAHDHENTNFVETDQVASYPNAYFN